MPRSLPWRIGLAFAVLALAAVLAVGATLFLVLRSLHSDATYARLADLSGTLVAEARSTGATAAPGETLAMLRGQITDANVAVYFLMANGRLVSVQGAPLPRDAIAIPASDLRDETEHGTVRFNDGTEYAYAATVLRNPGAPGARALVVATPDRSRAETIRDLVAALPAVLLILLLVGAPIAWLLSRSIANPLRRLARATADPTAAAATPLALDGPTEVREVTSRFNTMSSELVATRRHEAELLANLRHDLRTPLTVIAGFAAALTDGTATGPDAERAARAIGEEAGRLERLVGELGAIDRLRAGAAGLRPEPLDAPSLLAETVQRFAGRAEERGVSLEMISTESPDVPLELTADRLAVERMLANLVDNALGSVGAGGHVWLGTRSWDVPGDRNAAGGTSSVGGSGSAAGGTPPRGRAIVLTVTDDGPGFPPGAADRVFERFYRADPSRPRGGSGLGLTIVRELARAHGGDARAENVAPHGARVSIVLPIVPAPTGALAAGPAEPAAAGARQAAPAQGPTEPAAAGARQSAPGAGPASS